MGDDLRELLMNRQIDSGLPCRAILRGLLEEVRRECLVKRVDFEQLVREVCERNKTV